MILSSNRSFLHTYMRTIKLFKERINKNNTKCYETTVAASQGIDNLFLVSNRHFGCSAVISRQENVMDVFDRGAKKLQRERAAKAVNVDDFDYLKEEMGYRLADRVLDIKRKMKIAVDLGSGRGYVIRHLTGHSVEKIYALESSPTMLEQCVLPPEEENIIVEKLVFDEDVRTSGDESLMKLPFEDESIDIVTSSLSLHWVNNLPGLFKEVKRILRKDGVFLGSMFGGESLFELRCSLQMAELEREGGLGAHISPFVEVQDLGNLLNRTGFTMLTIDSDEIKVTFPSIFELMRDLKGMAENNASWTRKNHIHKDTLIAANAIYQEIYGCYQNENDDLPVLPATFQMYFWIGWKPDPKQPKALEPQKSDISLKDLYKLDEVVESKFQTEIEILDEVRQKNKNQNKERDTDDIPKT